MQCGLGFLRFNDGALFGRQGYFIANIKRLAPALASSGHCVDAAFALPLYVRDKVALTTEERAFVKEQKASSTPHR